MNFYRFFYPLPSLHPLFSITLAFMLGIGCTTQDGIWLSFMFLAGYLTHAYFTKTIKTFLLCLIPLLMSFYAGNFLLHAKKQSFIQWQEQCKNPLSLVATVTDITACATKNYAFVVTVSIDKFHSENFLDGTQWQTTPYSLMIYTYKKPSFMVQDKIFLPSINIKHPQKDTWQLYALKQNIGGTIFCKQCIYEPISRPSYSLKRWLWTTRKLFTERVLKKMSPETASYYALIFTGTHYLSKKNSEPIRTSFQLWGILHYLARSGLHVVLFLMIWNTLFLIIPFYRVREILLILLSLIYFFLSWPTLSFVRAFATYILYKTSSLCFRQSQTLHVFTLVTLFFLIANPIHLFCLDFQLSFGLTYALAWLQIHNQTVNSFSNS